MKKILIFFLLICGLTGIALADVVILHPNAASTYQDFLPSHGTNHWNLLNELDANSPEPTDSFVYLDEAGEGSVYYEFQNVDDFTASFTTIDSVVGYVRVKRGAGAIGTVMVVLSKSATLQGYDTATFAPTTSYVLYRVKGTPTDFDTKTELDGMIVGVILAEGANTGTLTKTQAEVYVYYTPPSSAKANERRVKVLKLLSDEE